MIINLATINFAGGTGGGGGSCTLTSATFTANSAYTPTDADGWSAVTVSVDLVAPYNSGFTEGFTSGETAGIAEQKALLSSTTITENGSFSAENGYSAVTVNIDGSENRLNKFLKGEITAITESNGDLDGVIEIRDSQFKSTPLVLFDGPNTRIQSNTFVGCTNLLTANTNTAPVAFQSVFENCTALTDVSITIPFSYSPYFGRAAFKNCKSLTALTFTEAPIRNYYNSDEALSGCSGLTGNYDVYSNDTTFDVDSLFAGCTSLTSVTFKTHINSLGKSTARNLFSGCTSMEYLDLTHCYKVPTLSSNLKFTAFTSNYEIRVPQMLYNDWTAATNWSSSATGHIVSYPNLAGPLTIRYTTTNGNDLTPTVPWSSTGWTTCGSFVSQEFDSTTGGTVVYSGYGSIPSNGLKNISNLASIEFDGYLAYIETSAFTNNNNLTSLVLPDTCQRVYNYGICNMDKLESIVFGTGLIRLDGYYQYMPSLTSITFKSTMPPSTGSYAVFSTGIPASGTVYVPASAVDRYKAWIKAWAESGTSSSTNFRAIKDWTVTAIQE